MQVSLLPEGHFQADLTTEDLGLQLTGPIGTAGFAECGAPPFLVAAKLPSKKRSLHSNKPWPPRTP
jgi:hypothetical protein